MIGNSLAQVSTCPTVLSLSCISLNSLPYLPSRSPTKVTRIRATSADTGHSQQPSSSSEKNNPLAVVLDVPRTIWRQTLRPLSDFGFGLFLVSGAVLVALSLAWLRGYQLSSRFSKYFAVFEFTQACGISTGTPVRIRGVTVGNVIRVNSSLESIEAVVEVEDDKTVIPRNALIEVNQSGLLMETKIDITPRDPLPNISVGPLHPECCKEGLIVCDRQKMRGHQGVSLDALVGIFTRLGREVEEIGIVNTCSLAERIASVIEEAKPLLIQIQAMAEDVQPLLAEFRESGLLKEVDSLTRSLTQALEDVRRLNSSVMTPENTEQIQKSVYTLIFTLKNIESSQVVSSSVLSFY
ncbi:protein TRIGALACTOSYLDIACYLGLYCEROL 2 [Pyrus ussuriensis x Pyrus communis]|uniref:Protein TRIGALACTOSYLDIACYLGLYCEROL 2 n=1 Tax=Pyrus ussuriensis x Pyrus communis TaxID=2448454 RepID=A0A5N5GGB9_9ROSA|nr:protein TRIGALACTOSYLDIACYLGLYCEROL 2 [Pyrus ussuriensis x Pyrus communis]